METSLYFAGIAAIISGLGAMASFKFARQSSKLAKKANQHAKDANCLQAKEWTEQYFNNVKIWADEVCDCIACAIHLDELDEDKVAEKSFEIRSKLSSLLDRGRWYFPNEKHEEHGLRKPPAYRGSRQLILDCIFYAYDTIAKKSISEAQFKDDLFAAQRCFVSEVQNVLNPRKRDEEINNITNKFKILDSVTNEQDDFYRKKFTKNNKKQSTSN